MKREEKCSSWREKSVRAVISKSEVTPRPSCERRLAGAEEDRRLRRSGVYGAGRAGGGEWGSWREMMRRCAEAGEIGGWYLFEKVYQLTATSGGKRGGSFLDAPKFKEIVEDHSDMIVDVQKRPVFCRRLGCRHHGAERCQLHGQRHEIPDDFGFAELASISVGCHSFSRVATVEVADLRGYLASTWSMTAVSSTRPPPPSPCAGARCCASSPWTTTHACITGTSSWRVRVNDGCDE